MTTATLEQGARRALDTAQTAAGLVARLLRNLERRRADRLAIAQLRAMSDHQLADLGIHRGQIEAAVRGPGRC